MVYEKITIKQMKALKEAIDQMAESEEQFLFMIFKGKNGKDHVTQYSWNMVGDKIKFYLREAINSGELRDE